MRRESSEQDLRLQQIKLTKFSGENILDRFSIHYVHCMKCTDYQLLALLGTLNLSFEDFIFPPQLHDLLLQCFHLPV